MAITSGTVFEVRTAGSDTNGGGFNPAAAGTDYSQTDTKRTATGTNDSVTDAVGNSTTTVTSATANFTSAITGNIVYIQGKWYEATFVNSTTITVDRATGTFSGGTLNIGGALATPQPPLGTNCTFASSAIVQIWIKQGMYTLTATITIDNNASGTPAYQLQGYTSSRGDFSTRPLFTTATNSTDLFTYTTSSSTVTFYNLSFSNTASTRAIGVVPHNSSNICKVKRCLFDGFTYALNGDNSGARYPWLSLFVDRTEIKNSTTHAIAMYNSFCWVTDSYIHDNTGVGIGCVNNCILHCSGTVIYNNTSYGIGPISGGAWVVVKIDDCSIVSNGNDGLAFTTTNAGNYFTALIRNSIFYSNTGYGINATSVPLEYTLDHCAYGANSTAALHNLTSGEGDVTLSADPFTNKSGGDFSLNSSAGGGAALKGVGYPGSYPGGTSTGGADIGAIQTVASSGSALVINPLSGLIA